MAVTITGAPRAVPTNISWSRNGETVTLTWEASTSDADSESNEYRVESAYVKLQYTLVGQRYSQTVTTTLSGVAGEYSWSMGTKNINWISGSVKFKNSKGESRESNSLSMTFSTPPTPTSSLAYDYTTGAVTCKLEGSEAVFLRPRSKYQMKVEKYAYISGKGTSTTPLSTLDCLGWDSNTEQYTYSKELTEETQLTTENDYITYTLKTWAVGPAGTVYSSSDSVLRISYPKAPVIQSFTKTTNGANIIIKYTDVTGINRADVSIKLQVQYALPNASLPESGWEDIGEEFTSSIVSLPVSDADIQPEAGQYVYFRAVATYFGRSTPSASYSNNYYYHPNPSYKDATNIFIEKATPNEDTASINLIIGYGSTGDHNATRLSYSTDAYAWKSTKEPETFEMPDNIWQDAESQSTHSGYKSSSITLAGLEEDTTYYLRAQRYNAATTSIVSLYSEMVACNTSQAETGAVVLSAPSTIIKGKESTFTWTYPTLPKNYYIKNWTLKNATNNKGVKTGTTETSCTYALSTDTSFCLDVTCYNDKSGSYIHLESNSVQVGVETDPALSWTTTPPTTLTTLPLLFKIGSGNASAKIQVNILNETGTKRIMPNGAEEQCAGDIVYSQTGYGSVTCSINDGTNFWNNGQYIIQAVATVEGIQSNTLTRRFNVNYSTKLSAPTRDNVKITPVGKAVNITVKNLDSDITCEIYRSTVDGRSALITDGLTINASQNYACDRFAPYALDGTCKYIILVKNAQNQYAYGEYEYTLKAGVLRFDWDSNSIELPYNIEISDEVDKQFEQQVYLDGTQRGSWGASVTRTATLSTDTVYIKDKAVQEKVRKLARYQGTVFVRTPLGQAYCANVDVKDISKAYNSNVMAVEFECTEIDLTSEFNAQSEIIASSEVVV